MTPGQDVWAIVPVKETTAAKQRLSGLLPAEARRALALAMLEDVLRALTATSDLAGIVVVTVDPDATAAAHLCGAEVWTDGARDGHTGAVMAAARRLAEEGAAMLSLPGDVPLITPADIRAIIDAHRRSPGFVIVPARDDLGSNAILAASPTRVQLRFGANSYFPHLDAARAHGIVPTTVRLPNIALDIDEPDDLMEFMRVPSATRAYALVARLDLVQAGKDASNDRAVA